MSFSLFTKVLLAALFLASGPWIAHAGQAGRMGHDHVLLGMHFLCDEPIIDKELLSLFYNVVRNKEASMANASC